MNNHNIGLMKVTWIILIGVIIFVFVQTDLFAADNLYKPRKTRDRQEDLYEDPDKSSNLFKPRKTRDREEDIYEDNKDASDRERDIYKDKKDTSDIYKPDENQQNQDRQKDIFKP